MSHFLVTGHTGFKGSWVTLLLNALGHEVSGFALEPERESLFNKAKVSSRLTRDIRGDIRDRDLVVAAIKAIQPDYVLHLAAQALVLESYRSPGYTYETNIMGTLNVLEATSESKSVRAQLIVTTDKVYLNQGLKRAYLEGDPLGGKDPYSASKASADILAQERLFSAGSKPGAIARAGNVLGAGDYSKNRLLPDLVRAVKANEPLTVRNPDSIRPWQHVLDCLYGYLVLLDSIERDGASGTWNIGPTADSLRSVADVLTTARGFLTFSELHPKKLPTAPYEEPFLALDSSKARQQLHWREFLDVETSIEWSLEEVMKTEEATFEEMIQSQVLRFVELLQRPLGNP